MYYPHKRVGSALYILGIQYGCVSGFSKRKFSSRLIKFLAHGLLFLNDPGQRVIRKSKPSFTVFSPGRCMSWDYARRGWRWGSPWARRRRRRATTSSRAASRAAFPLRTVCTTLGGRRAVSVGGRTSDGRRLKCERWGRRAELLVPPETHTIQLSLFERTGGRADTRHKRKRQFKLAPSWEAKAKKAKLDFSPARARLTRLVSLCHRARWQFSFKAF